MEWLLSGVCLPSLMRTRAISPFRMGIPFPNTVIHRADAELLPDWLRFGVTWTSQVGSFVQGRFNHK